MFVLMELAMWLEPDKGALHCVGVIAKLAKGYVAGVADVASEPVVGVVMI